MRKSLAHTKGSSLARKRKSKPTSKARADKQRIKDRYAHAREDAQLAGLIPTTPEEALSNERSDTALQDAQRFPGLDRAAVRNATGWHITEAVKRKIVENAAEMIYEKRIEFVDDGRGGKVAVEMPNRKAQIEAAKILLEADETQYKRDEPEKAGKAAGAAQIDWGALDRRPEPLPDPVQEKIRMIEAPKTENAEKSEGASERVGD